MALSFQGAPCPPNSMLMGVRWSVAYPFSYRHVEALLEERGVPSDHATIPRWVGQRQSAVGRGVSSPASARWGSVGAWTRRTCRGKASGTLSTAR